MTETHSCPWCGTESWSLKTMTMVGGEETRLKCDGCNAGFLLSDLPEALDKDDD